MSTNKDALRSFDESLPMLLLRARETAMGYFRPMLNAHGITEQQWRVMRALNETDTPTATALAKTCVILAPSMTRIVRKLVSDGLVRQRKSKQDGRETWLELTVLGHAFIAEIAPFSEAQYQRIRERLPAEHLEQLYLLLHEFVDMSTQD